MPLPPYAAWTLAQEARALLARLARVKPFALVETMVPAAAIMPNAQTAIENYLMTGRRELHGRVLGFLAWLDSPQGRLADADEAQQRFAILRLRFNTVLTHFDVFDDVLTQRSENETGVWWRASTCPPSTLRLTEASTRFRRSSATSTAGWGPRSGGRGRVYPGAATTRAPWCGCRGSAWSAAASRLR